MTILPKPTKATVEVADRVANSAAPMLAGLIGALVGVVGANTGSVRWSGLTLATLGLSVVFLIASIQAWMHGQSFFMDTTEVEERISGPGSDEQKKAVSSQTHEKLMQSFRKWVRRSRRLFRLGLLLFMFGLALVLLPPPCADESTLRWFAGGATALAALFGSIYAVYDEWKDVVARHQAEASSSGGG